MSNNWADLDHASMFHIQGANPVENHPASIAHLNTARYGDKKAELVVIDPRLTRTARLCDAKKGDFYARIRPGTDIAFINGVMKAIIDDMEAARGGSTTAISAANSRKAGTTISGNFFAYHNATDPNLRASRNFIADSGATVAVANWPKYCDSRALINASNDDYVRETRTVGSETISNFPALSADIWTGNTVYQKLRTHLSKYDAATVAAICGCQASDVLKVAEKYILHSRFNSIDFGLGAGAAMPTHKDYRATTIMYAMGLTQHTCGSQNVRTYAMLQSIMGNMGRVGGGVNALRGIHNVQGSTDMGVLFDLIPAYSGNPGVSQTYADYSNKLFGNRMVGATTRNPYVEGDLGLQQRGFYNMTREFFGSRAIGGAPSPTTVTDELVTFADEAAKETAKKLVGDPILATPAVVVTNVDGTVTYVVNTDYKVDLALGTIVRVRGGSIGLTATVKVSYTYRRDEAFQRLYDCWPKGNGVQHIEAIRRMDPAWVATYNAANPSATVSRIAAAVVWGQNPAVTEPNQGPVRKGLRELDLLVCADIFANETAQCDRKGDGVTYLLPAAAYVECAGSVASSGRWIQWRDKATDPKGNSKTDLELLLRLAKALSAAGAFDHIKTHAWAGTALAGADPYTVLYGKYGWNGTDSFEAVSGLDAEDVSLRGSEHVAEQVFKEMASPLNNTAAGQPKGTIWIYSGNGSTSAYNANTGNNNPRVWNVVKPSSVQVAGFASTDFVFTQAEGTIVRSATSTIPDPSTLTVTFEYGTLAGGWTASSQEVTFTGNVNTVPSTAVALTYPSGGPDNGHWGKANRAKSRKGAYSQAAESLQYPRYGWAWLLNRRCMYNNGELSGDVFDVYVAPAYQSRLFTLNTNTLADWSLVFRAYNTLADKPDRATGAGQTHELSGRFPGHTEPYETPFKELAETWGYNMGVAASGALTPLIFSDSARIDVRTTAGQTQAAQYPLVLTTIRSVEHFQGGPITRNNEWNVELEPDPWVEINSLDALKYGIKDGDWVNVETVRGGSVTDQNLRTITTGALAAVRFKDGRVWSKGFKARVGAGTQANQRVAPGVVAIPWHWGERGLGTGARANDLCIDAWDANTRIPEYKACLCKITKINS